MTIICPAVAMMKWSERNKREQKLKVGYGGAHEQLPESVYTPASWRNRRDRRRSTQPDRLDAKMEHAVFRAGRASDAGPGCITRWLLAALAREARRIRAIADDRSTTPCGVMFEESDSVIEKLMEGIRPHPEVCPPSSDKDGPFLPPYRPPPWLLEVRSAHLAPGKKVTFGTPRGKPPWLLQVKSAHQAPDTNGNFWTPRDLSPWLLKARYQLG
ncbi:hypothetical protein HPB47_019717 [Ixodes persulcatus]|uniref:Uncharacterized protein n=1 Tax=Ixodes persulcatus TaxID=34615 RepID=A0AC60QJP6_IXOPE|nr:hypothetical protein HPB47_019717 [Ixodes persulcatus]